MIRLATHADRDRAVQVLADSFDSNPAVNDTVVADKHRAQRMKALMEYLFDTGFRRNGVYVTDDLLGAIVMYDPVSHPENFSDTLLQLKLVHRCIGWTRLKHASAKRKKMDTFRPLTPHLYLKMIGIDPAAQGKGIGSKLISFIQELSVETSKPVYLETSLRRNVDMYLRKGFTVHGDWKIREDYHVHFMNWEK